jgi:copper chaperone CopZ
LQILNILQNNCHLLQQNENLQATAHLKKEEIKLTNKICKMCKKEIQNQLEDMNGDEDVNELDISIEDRNQKTNELVYS